MAETRENLSKLSAREAARECVRLAHEATQPDPETSNRNAAAHNAVAAATAAIVAAIETAFGLRR